MKIYNKLVRDKIPNVIQAAGKDFDCHIADKSEAYSLLLKKLDEEILEFKEDKNLEELADILEVVISLANNLGYSQEELIKAQLLKLESRGGFSKNIVLEKVYD
ncbi:nucleoside triphosphate pyrophosphohydrolase [Clostridium grantii]|uniref:Predicted house-cleaning noncanonical NTP pyrophosphatase, all-alpha NTP-PPase (MazG) superfamily n=1 Tax=Clostridium grantii DSM 8605 TaxID=1121316 RepID=A0A1M5X8Y4_9CLOT|nr:nucleoside triphosphate pyrophosphohydrolase [Clostridium grantii]SHH95673.1 Predicted house-cleaning noncanonical NTP pyrophosphatase, all-alpha NTP-PPase (MazG) superfamily [Clostridium grantii DSM 8605]